MANVLQQSGSLLRVIWACAKKDIKSALTERVFTLVGILLSANIFVLISLFVLGGGLAPTAVVMQENGPYARQLYAAMSNAHSFRLQQTSAAEANRLLQTGNVVAVVTIPPDFDTRLSRNQRVTIDVQINNLNTDFTNDIRRAVPLSITSFYAQAFPRVVTIVPREQDLYPQDTGYLAYLSVSILVIALMTGGIVTAGTGAAREWEVGTMKELMLSPPPRWAILVGKLLGAFLVSTASAIVVLAVLIGIIGVSPVHWFEVIGYTLLTLLIFTALGVLIGTLVKQRQLATSLSVWVSMPLFFISGAFGPISLDAPAIQFIARIFPVYYAIVLQHRGFHNFTLNTLGAGANAMILIAYALGIIVLAAVVLRRSTVAR